MSEWRDIMCREIDWWRSGRGGKAAHALFRLCCRDDGDWSNITLGDLANMGEREWLRQVGLGPFTVEAIKEIIDMAAEGKPVKQTDAAKDAYIPKCERRKE